MHDELSIKIYALQQRVADGKTIQRHVIWSVLLMLAVMLCHWHTSAEVTSLSDVIWSGDAKNIAHQRALTWGLHAALAVAFAPRLHCILNRGMCIAYTGHHMNLARQGLSLTVSLVFSCIRILKLIVEGSHANRYILATVGSESRLGQLGALESRLPDHLRHDLDWLCEGIPVSI